MTISVALCTYNGSKFLSKQLESILNQENYCPHEIIVCDDGSKDDTLLILEKFRNKYPSVFKIYKNDSNLGSIKNFEKAISFCTGDYIFLSDQDDIWRSDKIQKTFEVFEKNSKAEGVFSNANMIDDRDKPINSSTIWDSVFFFEKELSKPIDFFDLIAKNGNVVTGATLCIKKNVKDFIFPFSDEILHDQWIAYLLALRNTLFYSTENLISYRLHQNQQVGMKNINKINRKRHLKRIGANLEKPNSFNEYRFLSKRVYAKLRQAIQFKKSLSSNVGVDLTELVSKCDHELSDINSKIKSKYPINLLFANLIDNIRGKRKKLDF